MLSFQIILCVLAADFVTGAVHWWEDAYGLPSWPIIGQLVIEPNVQHHEDPTLMIRMGTAYGRNWQTLLLAALACGAAWLVGLLYWQVMLTAVLAGVGNEIHAWSHGAGGWPARLLQDMCLVQTPAHHARHHHPPYAARFCTLTNWVNPIVDRLQLWAHLEAAIAVAGVVPKRLTAERRGV